jgi:hypothetical protein
MALNLIDLLERLLGSNEVLSRIGALMGLSPEKTRAAIGAAVPAILAGLVGVAQKPEGRNQLAALAKAQDTNLLDNVTGALSGGRENALIDSGRGMLSSLFGQSQFDGLTGAVGRSTGLSQSTAGSLLGALAPMVLGALGREQRAQGLDAQGLAGMLRDQKDNIAHALPAGLASALGPTGLLDGVADRLGEGVSRTAQAGRATAADVTRTAGVAATTAAGSTPYAPRRAGGSMLRWIVGLAVLLAVLWTAYHFLWRGEQVREAGDTAPGTPAQVGEPPANLMVGDVDVGQQVTGVFESATATLNGVTDAASAEAALPKLNELNDSLTKLGGLVDQLPAEGKSALAASVSGSLSNLEALVAKVNAIPGVGDLIKPVAEPMLEKLRAMTV